MNDMMEHGATRVRIYLGKAHDMLLGFIPLVLLAKKRSSLLFLGYVQDLLPSFSLPQSNPNR